MVRYWKSNMAQEVMAQTRVKCPFILHLSHGEEQVELLENMVLN